MHIMANGLTVLKSRLLCYSGPVGSWDPFAQKPIGSSDPCAQKPIRPPSGSIAEAVFINFFRFFSRLFSILIMANGLTVLKSRLLCYSGPVGSWDPCAQKAIGSSNPCAQKPIRPSRCSIAEVVFINYFNRFFSMFIKANGLTVLKSRHLCYSGPIGSWDPCAQKPIFEPVCSETKKTSQRFNR